jgi:hypothetical protein
MLEKIWCANIRCEHIEKIGEERHGIGTCSYPEKHGGQIPQMKEYCGELICVEDTSLPYDPVEIEITKLRGTIDALQKEIEHLKRELLKES